MLFRSHRRGISLVEILFVVAVVAISITGTLSAMLFVRESLEVDKQRVIALNYARRQVELIRRNVFTSISNEQVTIDNFNTPDNPDDDLVGTMSTRVWNVNTDGTLASEVNTFPLENRNRVLVEVSVTWNRLGRQSTRTNTEVIRTYVAPR